MALQKPFNLNRWIQDNRHLLKPPVGNKNIYVDSDDYIVMIVAGPNARKDYHYNETEELFYQLEGSIKVIVQDEGERKEMELHAGDMYLHPAIEEPFGFAISEALMNGVPVAATRTGSTDLITHKKQGWILQENDVNAIIDVIKFYISDTCRRKDIAEAGQVHALKYLVFERMWKEQIALYQKCFG